MAKNRSKTWSEQDAGRVLDRADRSGLTDAAFSKRHRISPKRLSWWRRRLSRQKRRQRNSRFVEVRAVPSERIEIELRNGRRVRVPATIDVGVVAELADAIEGATDC